MHTEHSATGEIPRPQDIQQANRVPTDLEKRSLNRTRCTLATSSTRGNGEDKMVRTAARFGRKWRASQAAGGRGRGKMIT